VITRRAFLGTCGAAVAWAACGDRGAAPSALCTAPGALPMDPRSLPPPPDLGADPFALGVASGDPLPDGIVLWTRLAFDPASAEPVPAIEVPLAWQLARDLGFAGVVAAGAVLTGPEVGHSAHVAVRGLDEPPPAALPARQGQLLPTDRRVSGVPAGERRGYRADRVAVPAAGSAADCVRTHQKAIRTAIE
jgi:alkaline phosphatase D